QTMRLSSSRPSWSTPSQCSEDGPGQQLVPSASRFTFFGEYGAITGAKIAMMKKAPTMQAPTIAPGFFRSLDHASAQSPLEGGLRERSVDSICATDMSAQPDARVEECVRDVHDQVHDDEDDCEEQDAALEHRVVAVEDRVLEPAPHSRPREHRL